MKNITLFFHQNRTFLYFLLLEFACLVLLFNGSGYISSSINSKALEFEGTLDAKTAIFLNYLHLNESNENLLAENSHLKELAAELENRIQKSTTLSVDSSFGNNIIPTTQESAQALGTYDTSFYYIPATVVSKTVNRSTNSLILNKGIHDGVERNMAVLSSKGVVGIVSQASSHFSRVIPIINVNSYTSALISPSMALGFVSWTYPETKRANLSDIQREYSLQTGDSVFTSGYSLIFPPNELIGIIKEKQLPPGESFYDIELELAVDFTTLTHVYIAGSSIRGELDTIAKL